MALTDRLGDDADARLAAAETPPPGQLGAEEQTRPRRGRRPGSTNSRGASKSVIESTVASTLVAANAVIAIAARAGMLRPDDTLTADEIVALTDGVTAEAMAHPRLNKMISTAASVSPHVKMAEALIMVALPRLMRRGIIPTFGEGSEPANGLPVSMEARGTHGGGGGYGEWQEHPVGAPAGIPA